jgi:hypothetical protein
VAPVLCNHFTTPLVAGCVNADEAARRRRLPNLFRLLGPNTSLGSTGAACATSTPTST